MKGNYILRAENISKSFPGVKALEDVHLYIEKGKVHALMGENGAGKSTLMKILIGMYTPDSGQIYFKDKKIKFSSVHDALVTGLSMIHQEILPFPELSIAENIFMGNEPTTKIPGWINKKKLNKEAKHILNKIGAKIQVTKPMKSLSIAEMQMVEIAKAISNKAQVIIMDEPTSAISDREVNILFDIIEDLKQKGIAIIYISHKMEEILKIADTITIMRDGKYIATHDKSELNNHQLISLIVGRKIDSIFDKKEVPIGEVILCVEGLTGSKFKNINFHVKKGEILGIFGLMGSGRTEIVNAIFGLEKLIKGEIIIKGKKVKIKSPKDAIRSGIGLVSEDRKSFGLVLKSSVKHNITLSSLKKCSNGIFIDLKKEKDIAVTQIEKLRIKTPTINQIVNFLSGGNQQKIVIAKAILNESDIIILDEPTRGIDIGAKSEIYRLMSQLSSQGKAIIMVSSELPEILGMSDRILVIHEGTIKVELQKKEASQELIMKYAMA